MAVSNFTELMAHFGHEVEIAKYTSKNGVYNIAIECVNCGEVLLDFENDTEMLDNDHHNLEVST